MKITKPNSQAIAGRVGHGEKLSRKMEFAIVALMASPTIAEAAEKCGVGQRTLNRWISNPLFNDAYKAARQRSLEEGISLLSGACSRAASVLIEMVADPKTSEGVRERAARSIVILAMKGMSEIDIAERLENVERLMDERERRFP